MVTELGGTQISSLMETLPGIAQVLRSPVADAFVNAIRAAADLREFAIADAEEILRYGVRRNLMAQEESDRVLAEIKESFARRAQRLAERMAKRAATPPKARAKSKSRKAARRGMGNRSKKR